MMTTLSAKTVRQALDKAGVNVDRVCTRKGKVEVKDAYFYTMGRSAELLAAKVERALRMADVQHSLITPENRWAAWPKTSYFVAVIEA